MHVRAKLERGCRKGKQDAKHVVKRLDRTPIKTFVAF
jgi:hypothetical protein